MDVSSSAIGSYERCERQPTFELLHKYAKYFNVSIDYLLCNSDEKLTVEAYRQLHTIELPDWLEENSVTLDGVELSSNDKQKIVDIAAILICDKLMQGR